MLEIIPPCDGDGQMKALLVRKKSRFCEIHKAYNTMQDLLFPFKCFVLVTCSWNGTVLPVCIHFTDMEVARNMKL